MRALITGGTGFLGQQLGQRLQSLGHEVTLLGRDSVQGARLTQQGLRFEAVDLRDRNAMIAACQGQDVVFHCGALSSPWGAYSEFYKTNVQGTRHVIAGCQHYGVSRLVHVSTASVYFDYCDRTQISETDPLPPRPVNAYAATKRLAEIEVQAAHQMGLSTIILRPRGIIGPGDTALLPRLIRASARTGIPLIRQGQVLTDVTYVDNVVEALIRCQQAPQRYAGRIYNLTNGEPMPLKTLLNMVFERLDYPFRMRPMAYPVAYGLATAMEAWARLSHGQEPSLTRYTLGLLSYSQTLDISAARTDLGYAPTVSLPIGLDRFATWWHQTHLPLHPKSH